MEITVDFYFRQYWNDHRLRLDPKVMATDVLDAPYAINTTKVVGGKEVADMIWKPDTFFVNERRTKTKEAFVRILPDGEVLWSQRMEVTFNTYNAGFVNFPWDFVFFSLELESFSTTMAEIEYTWTQADITISPDVSLDKFLLTGHKSKVIEASLSSGNYSRLTCTLGLQRMAGLYTHTIFTPLPILAIIAITSSLLPAQKTTARSLLLATSIVSMLALKFWFSTSFQPTIYSFPGVYLDLHIGVAILSLIHFLLDVVSHQMHMSDSLKIGRVSKFFRIGLPCLLVFAQAAFWISTLTIPTTIDMNE